MKNKLFFSLTGFVLIMGMGACQKNPSTSLDTVTGQKTISLNVNGISRSFILYLPPGYNANGKFPMIFVIHGGSGTPQGMLNLADFRPIADRDQVILVYPEGYQKNWNDGRPTTPNQIGIDDVSFFNQLCDHLAKNYAVDPTRIYATGISNGGFMSSRLGCELSNRMAAIAVDAATMEATTIAPACNPGRPVPAMYIHGTADPLVPFTGGVMTANGTAGGTILSHFQVLDKWVSINQCNPSPSVTDLPDIANDGTTIRQRIFTGGTSGSEVVSYVVLNGGHTWPQGLQYAAESIIGKTSQDMNACEVIWTFFKRFSRK